MIPDTRNLTLRQLRLGGLRNTLDVRLQEARASQLDYIQFLELLLQDEVDIRQQRKIQRWTKKAGFREQKTLEAFDFTVTSISACRSDPVLREFFSLLLSCASKDSCEGPSFGTWNKIPEVVSAPRKTSARNSKFLNFAPSTLPRYMRLSPP